MDGHTQKCAFSVLDQKYSFWVNFVKENQDCQFKLKFGTKTNLNMENSIVMFIFAFFRPEINLLGKFVSKMKI